jgi:hypothetical protein
VPNAATAETAPIATLGPAIEHDPLFPERTNVEAIQILARDRLVGCNSRYEGAALPRLRDLCLPRSNQTNQGQPQQHSTLRRTRRLTVFSRTSFQCQKQKSGRRLAAPSL